MNNKLLKPMFALTLAASLAACVVAVVNSKNADQAIQDLEASIPTPESIASAVNLVLDQRQEAERTAAHQRRFEPWQAAQPNTPDGRHIYGNPDAEFTLMEFADIGCSWCKRFHPSVKQVVDASGGRVNWEWKFLPLRAQPQAQALACIGQAADNRAFWVGVHEMYEQGGNLDSTSSLRALALELGADADRYDACISNPQSFERIRNDTAEANSRGVQGTPHTVVRDNKMNAEAELGGAQPPEALMQAVASLRKNAVKTEMERSASARKGEHVEMEQSASVQPEVQP